MNRMLVSLSAFACALALGGADLAVAEPGALVVDDDGAQCADARFATINAAVGAASPGATVRVCPGVYRESVTIATPLTLRGDPEAVEAVDCFDQRPSQLGDLDPTRQVILDGSGSTALASLTLAADDIKVAGFVFQGTANPLPLPADDHMFRRAIDVSGAYSGYRIHHNVLRLNTVGIMLGGSGERQTRFDHNCMRENTWGLAADYRDVIDARVDHNASYFTSSIAFELFRTTTARSDIAFDHNHSRQDNGSYFIEGSKRSSIVANTIESPQVGIRVSHSNTDLNISHNVVSNPFGASRTGFVFQGIFFAAASAGAPVTTRALVSHNTVTGIGNAASGTGDAILAAGAPNFDRPAIADSRFVDNVTTDNVRYGIALRADNNNNTLRGNVSERNGSFGIFIQGAGHNLLEANIANRNGIDGISLQRTVRLGINYDATDNQLRGNLANGNGRDGIFADAFTARNTFTANEMFGNTGFDARDLAYPANTWLGNTCITDWPTGAICGPG
jgi:parallel beta-helix repeat protein